MSYCGFSDSSSDDDENEDIDLRSNNNQNQKKNEWIDMNTENDKQSETYIYKPRNNTKKATSKRKNLSSITAPMSLKEMKSQIYSNQSSNNKKNESALPPPLQGLNDDTNIAYNHRQKQYGVKQERRNNLNVIEHMSKSKHVWQKNPKITAVSAQVSVGIQINEAPFFKAASIKLNEVIHFLKNVEFRPEEFVCIRMKLKNPAMDATIFSNGKLTTQGGKSMISCTLALRKVARMLQQIEGYQERIKEITPPKFYGFQSTAQFGHKVNLQGMSEAHPLKIEYSPDIQSAYLNYRDPNKYGDKGVCRVYHKGTLLILGCSTREACIVWMEDIYELAEPFFIREGMEKDEEDYVRLGDIGMMGDGDELMQDEGKNVVDDDDDCMIAAPLIDAPLIDISPPLL